MTPIFTWDNHNCGDQLVFLHLARALAKANPTRHFVHFCNGCHIPNLTEVVQDLPQIRLLPFESDEWVKNHTKAVCVWKNHEDAWVESPMRWQWAEFTLWHHAVVARRMGLESPFARREHLLFDFPALEQIIPEPARDFLIIDGDPCSGQFSKMAQHGSGYLNAFIEELRASGNDVRTTSQCKKEGYSIPQIGALSLKCQHVLGVMTGPAWGCINTHRHHDSSKRTIFLMDNGEQLNLPGVQQVETVEQLFAIAEKEGWI